MREPMDIVTQPSQRTIELRPTEQKVVQAILGDITEAVTGSTQMPTEYAGVSEANVTHSAKAMGRRDVRELKLELAQAAAVGQCFLDGGADCPPSSADDILADISNMLGANRALVQPGVFRAVVVTLVAVRMTAVFDMDDGSAIMADEMRYRLARLRRPITTYHDSILQRMVVAMLSLSDVVVVFFMIGHVPEVIDSVTIAREYDARIVTIMVIDSPLAVLADVLLPIQAMEADSISRPSLSRYTMMMTADLLATEVALQRAGRSKKLLRHIKYVLDVRRGDGNRQPPGD